MYNSYKLIHVFGVPTPPVFAYCSGLYMNGTEAQTRAADSIAELEISVLSFGFLFPSC